MELHHPSFIPFIASCYHDGALGAQSVEDAWTVEKLARADPRALQKLRDLTLVPKDIDGASIDVNELRRKCRLDQSSTSSRISRSNDKATTQSLSQLDRLPLETMQQIFEDLDLQTLTDLRSVNQCAMSIVDSIPRYREIMTHVPDVLRAMLSTKLARHFKLIHLCSELRSDDCFLCGSFGAFLFLPACRRCCLLCLIQAEDTLPISKAQAKESFELTNDALLERPAMLTLPGSYGVVTKPVGPGGSPGRNKRGPTTYKSRMWLVNMRSAQQAAVDLHGRQRILDSYMMESRNIWTSAYARRDRCSDHGIAKPPFPSYTRGPNSIGSEPRRFMTAIRLPKLDIATGKTEWGVLCAGCREHYKYFYSGNFYLEYNQLDHHAHREYERLHTKVGFLRHMEICKRARRMWKQISEPTYIKVLKEHVYPETLDAYELPWEWDKDDPGYVIVKRWISESDQNILFEHTRRLGVPQGRWRKELENLAAMEMSGFKFCASLMRSSHCRGQSPVPDIEAQ